MANKLCYPVNNCVVPSTGVPPKIITYTFLTNETIGTPDTTISVFDDLDAELDETFQLCILSVSLPFGVETEEVLGKNSGKTKIYIVDDESK